MPFYLEEADILSRVAGLRSVLIVPCKFCPAASLAVREAMPYIEPLRHFLKTQAYELFVQEVRQRLEDEGIRAAVFDSKLPHQYVACMWTAERRRKLARRAASFDGVVVLGCEATTETVREALKPVECDVIQGMEMVGIMNILPSITFPFNVRINVQGITPVTASAPERRRETLPTS